MKKINFLLTKVIFICLLVIFIGGITNYIQNPLYENRWPFLFFVILLVFYLLCRNSERISSLFSWKVVIVICVFYFIILLFTVFLFYNFDPQYEIKYTNDAAKLLANGLGLRNNGNIDFIEYFVLYKNVINVTLYQTIFYKIFSFLGEGLTSNILVIWSCIKMTLVIPCIYYLGRKTKKIIGIYAIIMLIICLPIYANTVVVYNYTIVYLYPILIMTLYILGIDVFKKNKIAGILILVSSGIVTGIGSFIMITPIIVPIAILVTKLFDRKYRECKVPFFIIGIACVSVIFLNQFTSPYVEKHFYDEQKTIDFEAPPSIWIYTGLNYESRGLWNPEDWNQSFSVSGPSRNNYVLSLIENRINSMGKIKLFKHFINKTTVEFATGTFYSEIPLSYNLNNPEGSDIISKFRTVCQNYHMVILFLIIVYLYNKKSIQTSIFDVCIVSLLGIFCATIFNETSPRHLYPFIPFLYMIAANGLDKFGDLTDSFFKKRISK
ncbi:MAG: hypothetical protein VB122_03475 [Erysipelotrichales bacterium]|nr:hypothetical protein [Erysipelotrichales bacterium]